MRKVFTFIPKVKIVLGITTAIFVSGLLIYEPIVQSSIVHTIVVPEPIIIPENPEIPIVALYQTQRNSKLPVELAELQAKIIVDTAVENKLPTSLIVSIIEAESTFNPLSQSSVGARGLMQVYQSAKVDIDKEQSFNLVYNVQKGCEVLKEKLDNNSGDLSKALSDYSGGAKDYTEKVYVGVGRYEMFKQQQL